MFIRSFRTAVVLLLSTTLVRQANAQDPRAAALRSIDARQARYAEVARLEEIEPALTRLAKDGVDGLVVLPTAGLFVVESRRIVKLALARGWPVVAGPAAKHASAKKHAAKKHKDRHVAKAHTVDAKKV